MECELLRSPMISYRSLLYNTTVLYDTMSLLLVALLGINTAMSSLTGLLYLLECSPEGVLASLVIILTLEGVSSSSKISFAT